jgi:hypothetical protein
MDEPVDQIVDGIEEAARKGQAMKLTNSNLDRLSVSQEIISVEVAEVYGAPLGFTYGMFADMYRGGSFDDRITR